MGKLNSFNVGPHREVIGTMCFNSGLCVAGTTGFNPRPRRATRATAEV